MTISTIEEFGLNQSLHPSAHHVRKRSLKIKQQRKEGLYAGPFLFLKDHVISLKSREFIHRAFFSPDCMSGKDAVTASFFGSTILWENTVVLSFQSP